METNVEEIWKDVVGYEGIYQISNLGRVKSLKRSAKSFIRRGVPFVRICQERILSTSANTQGYLQLQLSLNGESKPRRVHRLVAIAFIPNPLNKPEVNHKDGDKTNNHVSNLEWATESENCLHAYRIGLHKDHKPLRGENVGGSKLNAKQVIEIRSLYSKNRTITLEEVGKKYNVSANGICSILKGRNWRHLL